MYTCYIYIEILITGRSLGLLRKDSATNKLYFFHQLDVQVDMELS